MRSNSSLSPGHRIRVSTDFSFVYRKGYKMSGYYYTAFFVPSSTGNSRIGVSVSRKIGKAVVRNTHKRLAKEAFRLRRADFAQPLDVVVTVNLSAAGQFSRDNKRVYREELERILHWLSGFCMY